MTARLDPALLPPSPDLAFELPLWNAGLRRIGGVDEAGRGAWAGPVSAGVVILPPDPELTTRLSGVRDSKQMTPAQRCYWAGQIQSFCSDWGVGFASSEEIDLIGIVPATHLAIRRAMQDLASPPEYLLVDFLTLAEIDLPQQALIKGDARSLSIAAASVLAKTSRDALLVQLGEQYPGFGFASHKGYGTGEHRLALERFGPTPIHRRSFAPIRACCADISNPH